MDDQQDDVEQDVRSVVEAGLKEVVPDLQDVIQQKTGKRLSEAELQKIIEPALAEVATEITFKASHAYVGPMPSPHVMQGYAQLYPDAPAQLFQQFKAEQDHRHNWENQALRVTAAEGQRRDNGAYIIAACGIACAAFIAYLGAHAIGAVLAGAVVLGGGALVLGRQFLASHDENGTKVTVNSDDQGEHRDVRSQQSSRKQNTRVKQHKGRQGGSSGRSAG